MKKILNQNENMKKNEYEENPEPKREYEKRNMRKILNRKEDMKKTNMRKFLSQKKKIAKRCIKRTKNI